MQRQRGVDRWELCTCGRRGHVTYAPDDPALAAKLSGSTGEGEVWRCLRCGEFTLGAPQGRGPAQDAPMVLRGKALRQAIIVRALAIERWVRAVLLGAARPRCVGGVEVPRRARIDSGEPGSRPAA